MAVLFVQVKVKPNKKDKTRCDKWGVDKTRADEMEYKLWDMQDALDKVQAEQRRVQHEVRPPPHRRLHCSTQHWKHPCVVAGMQTAVLCLHTWMHVLTSVRVDEGRHSHDVSVHTDTASGG